jgi:hypothetical protein
MRRCSVFESTLEKLAERILSLDEASLSALWKKYKDRMEHFDASRDWERSVIVFFIINAVRAKNQIFNERILQMQGPKKDRPSKPSRSRPDIKRVK